MFYRIRIDAAFTNLPPRDWLERIRDYFLANAETINPGQENEEPGFISLEKCYHDEESVQPCEVLEQYQTS